MKTIELKPVLKICFINEHDDRTAEIINPPANFIVPRIGEHFELTSDGRTNIVTDVYHDILAGEVLIWYNFFHLYENKILEEKDIDDRMIPKEKL